MSETRKSPFRGLGLLVVVVVLVWVLDHPMGSVPAIGRLLDPMNGCWANAEPVDESFNADHKFPGIQHTATVWIDDQLVPHIHAADDHDLYFIEGYIHAQFRLWQMDMETRAAGGRVSEVIGAKGLAYDRKQRLKGMVYAAENSLKAMEADPHTKQAVDAYTEGINHYISSLNDRSYPLEYKLMGFVPEPWTNLKTALLLKYMADDLTGKPDDLGLMYLRDVLPKDEFELLFPEKIAGSTPVIPRGTQFDKPSHTVPVAPPDSVAFPHFKTTDFEEKREDGKGSNNWAVGGTRTASGSPILCNDPHLMLNLPSLWFAIQLQTPEMNVYGASLPGAPGVIIGFNDSVSWGLTNNYRDVKDYYLIKPVDGDKNKYWFDGKQVAFTKRVERIGVKGKPDVVDTIDYTLHGPVTYATQNGKDGGLKQPLAVCWMGHRGTNELLAIYKLNRANNYEQYVDAIMNFQCPAQNFVYADRAGNIAMWGQGQFVNKWKGQGTFIMEGADSLTLWKELIPMRENPHVLNPGQGYVSSANQSVTDDSYPYWYNGDFVELRAWRINQLLSNTQKATVQDMFAMQNDTYSMLAAGMLPVVLNYLSPEYPNDKYIDALKKWDYRLAAEGMAGTVFQVWWSYFFRDVWEGNGLKHVPGDLKPLQERTMQLFLTDTDPATQRPVSGYYAGIVKKSYKEALDSISKLEKKGDVEWYKAKNTSVTHLAKLPAFSYDHLKMGGWGNTINAAKGDHGPSWRMVVQMGKGEIEAYGVYPGGQSGNPGSKYYAEYLQKWVDGKYNRLLFLPNADKQSSGAIKYVWTVN
jgi:penicillin amidase